VILELRRAELPARGSEDVNHLAVQRCNHDLLLLFAAPFIPCAARFWADLRLCV
jgi:hypothetical protein